MRPLSRVAPELVQPRLVLDHSEVAAAAVAAGASDGGSSAVRETLSTVTAAAALWRWTLAVRCAMHAQLCARRGTVAQQLAPPMARRLSAQRSSA